MSQDNANTVEHSGTRDVSRGMLTLFCTQIFSTLSYAILLQTLTLYGTQQLGLSVTAVMALTGSFLAFNFGLHFLGGVGCFTLCLKVFFIFDQAQQAGDI